MIDTAKTVTIRLEADTKAGIAALHKDHRIGKLVEAIRNRDAEIDDEQVDGLADDIIAAAEEAHGACLGCHDADAEGQDEDNYGWYEYEADTPVGTTNHGKWSACPASESTDMPSVSDLAIAIAEGGLRRIEITKAW